MSEFDRKKHWENIYETKSLHELSWYQPTPETSLEFIKNAQLPLDAKIIDIGGGDSFLVDHLIELGYTNISVLDISAKAIERAKERLGEKAVNVIWIVSDICEFKTSEKYDFWHDRAAFHFLTAESDITTYLKKVTQFTSEKGLVVIGTFSESGPLKCSGIEIKQYATEELQNIFFKDFEFLKGFKTDHKTPFETIQSFTFCEFRKK
jgi:2-polyprenyl-3-methyl-5-hydroxy-6-metoxy-1,4-benzoquinol methylase